MDTRKEAELLAAINDRFEDEPKKVQNIRREFKNIFHDLIVVRDEAGRGQKGKIANIAITELRKARAMAIEALYTEDE